MATTLKHFASKGGTLRFSGLSLGRVALLGRWLFTRGPTTAAIDVTHRCNLKCLHCYWWRETAPRELDDAALISMMTGLKARGIRAAILYGGEPTLRPKVCKAAGEIFDATLAFTNGTNGFPELSGGQWILSLDGPEEVNDRVRGKGVYALAVENLKRASRPPIVHMTICRLNQARIEEFVRQMLDLPIKGIGFSFMTPAREDQDAGLFIPLEERDRVVKELLRLKAKYGLRVGFTSAMARQYLTDGDYYRWNSYATCPVPRRVLCFQADGRPKRCTYGDRADCSRCGCAAVAAFRGAFSPLDPATLRVILGLLVPGYGDPKRG